MYKRQLPCCYATASAETFAASAVKLLDSLNCVDYLCFGCETDNIKVLPTIVSILLNEPDDFKNMLSLYLKNGYSFPKARAKALTDYCLENNILQFDELDNLLNKPNNILAIEYLKAIKRLNSSIKPVEMCIRDSYSRHPPLYIIAAANYNGIFGTCNFFGFFY